MVGFRKYGISPYSVVLLHGGPGAPGTMKPLAEILSQEFGIIEPMQTQKTIIGQVNELEEILKKEGEPPFVLIGHSWGAWLGYIFAAKELLEIKRLILVGSGPFQEKYVESIDKTRSERLTEKDIGNMDEIMGRILNNPDNKEIISRFEKIMSKIDSYDPISMESPILEFQPDVFSSIMAEVKRLRKSGMLLNLGRKIKSPVTAFHGDFDPHPFKGVKEPLAQVIENFSFYLLEKCGHVPWQEREAQEKFLQMLKEEIKRA